MSFFIFLGISLVLGFTFYGIYVYVTKEDNDDEW